MSDRESKVDRIERAMTAAHARQPAVAVDGAWQQDVMRDVRMAHAARQVPAFAFSEYVLKWAAIASAMAICFAVYTIGTGWDPSADLVRIWTDDPAGFTTAALLGY